MTSLSGSVAQPLRKWNAIYRLATADSISPPLVFSSSTNVVSALPQNAHGKPFQKEPVLSALSESLTAKTQSNSSPRSLEEVLFENRYGLKVAFASLLVHIGENWRRFIFEQLDSLLDLNYWDVGSSLIDKTSFMTFLRFLAFATPSKLPNLGVGPTGNILTSWWAEDNRLVIEFLDRDQCSLTFVRQSRHGNAAYGWHGHVADLLPFVAQNGMKDCLGEAD